MGLFNFQKMYSVNELPEKGYSDVRRDLFTGKAWLKTYVSPGQGTNAYVGEVLFEPGGRNN